MLNYDDGKTNYKISACLLSHFTAKAAYCSRTFFAFCVVFLQIAPDSRVAEKLERKLQRDREKRV